MSLTSIPGNGVLLCPKGVGYGTLSQSLWESLSNPASWDLQEISAAVFGNWLCNLKIVDVVMRVVYEDNTDPGLNTDTTSNFEAHMMTPYAGTSGGADHETADAYDNPFPLNQIDSVGDLLLQGVPNIASVSGIRYYFDNPGDGYIALPAEADVPSPFIRDDKFYMAFPVSGMDSHSISISLDEIAFTTVEDIGGDGYQTITRTWTANTKFHP